MKTKIDRGTGARFVVLALGLALAGGCASYSAVGDARRQYEYGHYEQTIADLKTLGSEAEARDSLLNGYPDGGHRLALYYVYLGLAHYKLGHRAEALASLTKGRELYQKGELGWLPPADAQDMDKALVDLRASPTK